MCVTTLLISQLKYAPPLNLSSKNEKSIAMISRCLTSVLNYTPALPNMGSYKSTYLSMGATHDPWFLSHLSKLLPWKLPYWQDSTHVVLQQPSDQLHHPVTHVLVYTAYDRVSLMENRRSGVYASTWWILLSTRTKVMKAQILPLQKRCWTGPINVWDW